MSVELDQSRLHPPHFVGAEVSAIQAQLVNQVADDPSVLLGPKIRRVVEPAGEWVFSAMARVGTEARSEMQTLLAAFMADPGDKAIVAQVGALLQDGRLPDH